MKKLYYLVPFVLLCAVITSVFTELLHEAKFAFAYSREYSVNSPILIIDPGHGGADGGAVSENGTVEADINLDIGLKIRDIAGLFRIPSVMTRQSDDIYYPEDVKTLSKMKLYDQKTRKDMINSMENGVLISIHQNIFPSKKPYGAQVLYASNNESRLMGEVFQSDLVLYLNDENRRTAAEISDTIYLLKGLVIPSILIECGFLSNEREEALLNSNDYRLKLSAIILSSYIKYTTETK